MNFLRSPGMVPHMQSKSRFNRRLHQVRELVVDLFFQLSSLIKELNISSEYSIDSFPIQTCDLANDIEFSTPVKHLQVGESYVVQYTLKCLSSNCIPEVMSWSSGDPSVATVDSDGKVIAKSKGEAIIKGKICEIENTFTVQVGYDCEQYFCENTDYLCYNGVYKGTGIINFYLFDLGYPPHDCGYTQVTNRIVITVNFGESDIKNRVESTWLVEHHYWNRQLEGCDVYCSNQTDIQEEGDYWPTELVFNCSDVGFFHSRSNHFNYLFDGTLSVKYTSDGTFIGDVLILDVKQYVPNVIHDDLNNTAQFV